LLYYAWHDGTSWPKETVDDPTRGGRDCALALDAAGRPHIGYEDSAHGDVKYAHLIDCVPVEVVTVTGPASLPAGASGLYTATYAPPSATVRLLSWDNGATGARTMYDWLLPGPHRLTATADYYCAATTGTFTVTIFCQPPSGAAIQGPGTLVPGLAGRAFTRDQGRSRVSVSPWIGHSPAPMPSGGQDSTLPARSVPREQK